MYSLDEDKFFSTLIKGSVTALTLVTVYHNFPCVLLETIDNL